MTKAVDETICDACKGTRQDSTMRAVKPYRKLEYRECPVCKGTGKKLPKADSPAAT
jgi:hypothetical protein